MKTLNYSYKTKKYKSFDSSLKKLGVHLLDIKQAKKQNVKKSA